MDRRLEIIMTNNFLITSIYTHKIHMVNYPKISVSTSIGLFCDDSKKIRVRSGPTVPFLVISFCWNIFNFAKPLTGQSNYEKEGYVLLTSNDRKSAG